MSDKIETMKALCGNLKPPEEIIDIVFMPEEIEIGWVTADMIDLALTVADKAEVERRMNPLCG